MDKNPKTSNQIYLNLKANSLSPPRKRSQYPKTPMNPRMTVQCMQFKKGDCSYGQNCQYAHVNGDQIDVTKYGDDGCGRIISKAKPCRTFLNGKFCPFGEKCHFLHQEPSANFRKGAMNVGDLGFNGYGYERADNRKMRICHKWEETGRCPYGTTCNYAHGQEELYGYERSGNRKTRLCHKWEKMGSCSYGTTCIYAHGQEELRRFCFQSGTHHKVVSSSGMRSPAAAAPEGSCWDTADESATEEDKKCLKWKCFKKLNGIYADWIDEMPLVYSSPCMVGDINLT